MKMESAAAEWRKENPELVKNLSRKKATKTGNLVKHRRQRLKATYMKTGESVFFDTIKTANKMIGGPYSSMQKHINQGRVFKGFLLERVDPED